MLKHQGYLRADSFSSSQLKTHTFAHQEGCVRKMVFFARAAVRQSLKRAKQVAPEPADMGARR